MSSPRFRLLLFLAILLLAVLLGSLLPRSYFISDPYWETATGLGRWQMRLLGLRSGYWVHFVPATRDTTWLPESQESEESQDAQDAQGAQNAENAENGAAPAAPGLKARIEALLSAGEKVILSPYWWRDLEKQALEFERGQLVLVDAVSRDVRIQSVQADLIAGWRQLGQIAADYVRQHPQRQRVIAIFYRGSSYDKYAEAFAAGFETNHPDPGHLVLERYYAAEINQIKQRVQQIDLAETLVVLALSQLSDIVFRKLAEETEALFILENYGDSPAPYKNILLSLDTDFRQLWQQALQLPPLLLGGESDLRVQEAPYTLHTPVPERLHGIAAAAELVVQAKQAQNRWSAQLANWWQSGLRYLRTIWLQVL